MADASITLTKSQNSSSSGVTFRGYVIDSCDNSKVDDGDWEYDIVTGITASTDSNKITIWNTNATDSSVSNTFTWTSSKVSGCTKTLYVTTEGKDYCPGVSIELYDTGNNIISGTSTNGSSINITITITDWKDIPESNKKKFDSFENGGNNITYSFPSGYVMGWNVWNNDNTFVILGELPDECPDGDYTFSVTVCGNTVSKTTTKRSANYKFYHKEFFSLVEISGWSESYTIYDNNYTYSLNEIIEGQKLACAESPNDNSVSASLLTVSNFSSNNSNFTFSSLAINDDDDPSGFFYIGVKCNTNNIVNLLNGNSEFSATMTFDLSYSNASIPVTININKVITEKTLTFEIDANNNLYDDEGDFWGVVTYYVNDVSKFSYNFVCGPSSGDSKSSSINITIDSSVTIKTIISMTAEYYKSAPNIDITTYGFKCDVDSISSIQSNTTYTKTYSTTLSVSDFSATSSKTFGVLLSVNR